MDFTDNPLFLTEITENSFNSLLKKNPCNQ